MAQIVQISSKHKTIKKKGTLANMFYEVNITIIPKADKDVTRKENDGNRIESCGKRSKKGTCKRSFIQTYPLR